MFISILFSDFKIGLGVFPTHLTPQDVKYLFLIENYIDLFGIV